MCILVGEDNAVNRELVGHLLTQLGHVVVMAHSGSEVLARHTEQSFELILLDYWMPGMDGLEACLKIRERERLTGKRTPIVALTAHAVKGDRDACMTAGMDDYLIKPVRLNMLADVIRRLVQPGESIAGAAGRQLVDRWEGIDAEILFKLGPQMVKSVGDSLSDLRAALAATDWHRLQREAHSLRGSLALFNAPQVVETAHRLENAAKRHDPAAEQIMRVLAAEVADVQVEVRARCGELVGSAN